ncbi:MAG: endo-1,4-beta-xylanase [Bacteroidetes bacterium]|nr:endo-1,4-beta-xylanase [Bacteroidota bacterium]
MMKNIFWVVFLMAFLSGYRGIAQEAPSLKEAYKDDFLIGTALNMSQVEERNPAASALIARQFSTFTPENNMKAALIHPGWNQFNFSQADEIVQFAEKYHLKVNGHTLIWHSQLPMGVARIQDADSVRQWFTGHITTVAGRYDGKVYSWDVVNEALNEDGTLRKSVFQQKLGDDYIVEAFRLAQKAAPHTQLYYNDYNIEHGKKREGAVELVKKIQAAGVRIDGVGIQGHWSAGRVPLEDIEQSIVAFSALGVKVMFTELDLSVLPSPRGHNTADVNQTAGYADALNPYVNGLPDSAQALLANSYAQLFRLFMKYKDKIGRVTFWGVDDGQSWLNGFPVRGRTNYPLLFDRQLKAKPAFYRVIEAAKGGGSELGRGGAWDTARGWAEHADNGDGTFTNPVIFADYPDMDVIRVGDDYYMVSTTMFIFPGVTVLKSKDLVNWEYCSNAVPRMDCSKCYNLDSCNRYHHGQWATSLKYHNGLFYLFFNTLDDGGFVATATKPEGPWNLRHLPKGFHDPGLFFDEDGRIYVAFGYNTISVAELDENLAPKGPATVVFKGDLAGGLEGSHVYKLNGYYYLYSTYGGGNGFQVALRSKSIYGPYEEKVVLRDREGLNRGIHQGALIQTQTGEWWTMLFLDKGPFGRMPSLQPVRWEDGWPIAGVDGKGVATYRKPNVGKAYEAATLPTSDEFNEASLPMQWGWNHNPDSSSWSLSKRPGSLRLTTAKVVADLPHARNTLTQRMFGYYSDSVASTATTKISFSGMKDGDEAGLAVFQDPYGYIAVRKVGKKFRLVMVNNGAVVEERPLEGKEVYLRAAAVFGTGKARFSFSPDNMVFTGLGNELAMRFNLSIFTGNKWCLFNYATKGAGGYVDFDWFRTGPK